MGAVYTQLSISKRRKTERWRHPKVPVDAMARVPDWSESTIHREINVISGPLTLSLKNAGYFGHTANCRCTAPKSQ